ncbi:ATP-binding cassette domain-containing protein [Alteriqipengyuania sp. WL0013]|uniref:ABC transporter ATP-binding protein n=1 Tax=Alteriqipengyuania sp. WL0013 TaxID=3110773 RepID=UPI002BEB7509|nr:ATP-binding cassette domain-containing protein [Alteriqipengyuania sp. WL0013]MEB3416257.1 ATP-binding cassette domain-containing protein [Alteriqipengyuania sp. WL0013]
MPILEIDHVTKRFDGVTAVDDLSFAVEPGEIYGFLGGNGAGKTTTLRMVLDIIRPTSGRIAVFGEAPGRRHTHEIGFLPEERGLYGTMSAIDTIVYFGRLKGMERADAKAHGLELLDRFGLADRAKSQISDMSKGMAQKVQLATSLVNRPQLLILDEPFSGLDPVNQGLLEDEILRSAGTGAAVVFSTHVMQHAERLCDRLLLLGKGTKRFEGTLEEARGTMPSRISAVARQSLGHIAGVASSHEAQAEGDGWTRYDLELEQGVAAPDVLERMSGADVALRGFEVHRPSLHEVFVHLVGSDPETPAAEMAA